MLRRSKTETSAVQTAGALEASKAGALAPSVQDLERKLQDQLSEQSAEKARQEAETLMKLKLPAVSTKKTEVLIKHIGVEAKKDPTAMAQVVRTWLHDTTQR